MAFKPVLLVVPSSCFYGGIVVLKVINHDVLQSNVTGSEPLVVVVVVLDWLNYWWIVVEDSLLLDVAGIAVLQSKKYPAAGW